MTSRGARGSGGPHARAQQASQQAARVAAEQAALRRRDRHRLIALVVVLVVVVVGGGIGLQAWRTGRSPQAVPAGSFTEVPQMLVDGQPLRWGSVGAATTVQLYEDFHCPHCVDFEEEFGATLTAAQTAGTVRLELYPMAFIDEGSSRAANAVACATEAGFGQQYYLGLFGNADLQWSDRQLVELGTLSSPDVPASFATCVTDAAHAGWVESVNTTAAANGVTQTPSLFVDGAAVDVTGLTPESLQTMIDAKG